MSRGRLKPSSKKVMHIDNHVRIHSRTWDLVGITNKYGGCLTTVRETLPGRIMIGLQAEGDPIRIVRALIHEILEGILLMNDKRFPNPSNEHNFMFMFDHDFLEDFCQLIVDSYISCGLIALPRSIHFRDTRKGIGKTGRHVSELEDN